MDSAALLALGLAFVNMAQVLLLAIITGRQHKMAANLDGHLSRLDATQATDEELAARPPPPNLTR